MLTKRNVSEVDRRAERIRRLQADVQTRVIAIGFELLAAKKEIGHGGWANWLRTQFSWSERTARNFMNIAARFGNRQVFSTLQPSTLIELLALPKGDEEPFIEAQAEAGEPVESLSARQVKQKVDQWRDAKDADEKKPRLTYCTGNPEWYTPSKYIDAAREVLGEIDLDPASCALANETVRAKKFFSLADSGLTNFWHGRIWLNPPFAAGLIEKFVSKLLDEFDAGRTQEALVLTDNCTETRWFRSLVARADVLLFTNHRINFIKSDGSLDKGTSQRGQCFFYFGSEVDEFCRVFSQFGYAVKLVSFKEEWRDALL